MSTLPARRVLVISADDALSQRLASGPIGALGAIEVYRAFHADAAEPPPALWLIQVTGEPVPACRPIVALAPGIGLAAVVALLQESPDVAAVVAGHGLDPRQLFALANRVVTGELSGLDGALAIGTQIVTQQVGDHGAKLRCLAQAAALVERARLPAALRASIEQCIDELVTNALYAAPVDARGRPLFASVAPRARRVLRTDRDVSVQYAWDGARFAVAVRDTFGTLERATVLRHLHDGLHAAQPVGGKGGSGAGLGLYLIAQAATAVCFHVVPGVATEVVCVFELGAPAGALAQLGVVHSDPAGRTGAGAARRRLTRVGVRRRARTVLGALGALALAAVVAVGALAVMQGRARTAERTVAPSYTGERAPVVPPRAPSADEVRVRFGSRPAGALIVELGRPPTTDHTYTPAELFVAVNQEHRFMLTMPGHVPLVIEPFTPVRGTTVLDKGGELALGATLQIEASLAGTGSVVGAAHCQAAALPFHCTLAPGRYAVEYAGADHARIARDVTMTAQDEVLRFELGIIEAAPGVRLAPGDPQRQIVEAGPHKLTVSDGAGSHPVTVIVAAGGTVIAQ
jgi:hypothetical protein